MKCPKCGSEGRLRSNVPTIEFDQKGNVTVILFAGCNDCDLTGELKGECKLKWVWHDGQGKEGIQTEDSETN